MLPSKRVLRGLLRQILIEKERQGHVVATLDEAIDALPDSYDALLDFAHHLAALPLRPDWPYVEPNGLDEIWAECDPERPLALLRPVDLREAAAGARAGFLGLVCGCVLGKPLEIDPTFDEIHRAAEAVDEWPLADFASAALLDALGRRHSSWIETIRDRIDYVACDDDINYPIVGMLLVEQRGLEFTQDHILALCSESLPFAWCWGPERMTLLKAGIRSLGPLWGVPPPPADDPGQLYEEWAEVLNPGSENCGALIRIDAYGYACPGRPALAAELAWRDASLTHRRTGIYAAMFLAAALATAAVADDRLQPFEVALAFVPRRSRFYEAVVDQLTLVRDAENWLDGYRQIHARYGEFRHCEIYQEIGTLMNTVRFAESVGDGICKQVSQGNDTDSFGARAGSFLGVLLGPDHLEKRWLARFNDDLRTTVATLHERSLSRVADRMAALPKRSFLPPTSD
jgi:ADP-ribosylglycohydrolase